MGGWIDRWMKGRIDIRMDRLIGLMDEWMGGWIDRWINGYMNVWIKS